MVLETRVRFEGMTTDDIVAVYRIFCQAYGITSTNRDEEILRLHGIEPLTTGGFIDFRPYDGAQFLCTRTGDEVLFIGHCRRHDYLSRSKNMDLQERIKDYFMKKDTSQTAQKTLKATS